MLFGLALILTFVPVFPGAGTSPRWMLLSLAVPLMLLMRNKAIGTPWLGVLFLLYASISLAWAPDLNEGMQDVWKMYVLGAVFLVGTTYDLRGLFTGLAIGFAVNSALVVAQVYGWDGLPQTVAPAGLFSNKNFGGEAAALVLVGLVATRQWWLIPLPLVTLVLSGSKAGLLAAAIGVLAIAPRGFRWGAAALLMVLGNLLHENFAGHSAALLQRLNVWRDLADNMTLFGHGAGSFYILMPSISHYNVLNERFDFAHNDLLQLFFEYGIGALPLVIGLVLAFWHGTSKVAQSVLIAFAVESCFGFPLHLPVTAFIALLCAGHLSRDGVPLLSPLFHGKPVLRGRHAHG